ncbi:hypothetical protein RND71_005996 [Anisodus tanguticus]|uniref:Ribosomal protein eL8/eL30/eS12/Gadd45 domain-containing protein n=1 Tax=Anisodus tanguticus TaxID=243964 RepID=A0AAE1SSY4_9SOLA|nr:hypothetical protein RND71_005996 [Anisodus tanguticus]
MAPKKGVAVAAKKKPEKGKVVNPVFEKRPRQFGIGGALPPKRDLGRFVRMPKVVQLQRKKRILKLRLKVPPALNQFTKTLDKNLATSLFKMLLKYRPEDKSAKKERLVKRAQAEAEGKTPETKKPIIVKYGLKHITYLIEQNKAQLVVIAHDVDPIELVVWLPALCRKMEIPYCIVKGKARLGSIVHKKTASALCLTTVKNEDKMEFSRILEAIKANFNDKYEENRKKWGGGIMGSKSQARTKAKERAPKKGVAVAAKKKPEKGKVVNPLFEKRSRQFGIGGALPPKKDLGRFVRMPKVVQLQRKKRILKQRLKVPPALNQFTKTLDKNLATNLFKMLLKYRPEDKAAKKERLVKRAQAEAEGKTPETKKPIIVKYGLKHITYLIEQNKAQLVVIAHDVDPIELVVWLPALCRKMEIPYCIVKGKARLGSIVHKKTASALCLTTVKNEDKMEFSRILEAIKANFNDKYEENRKKWGGGIMGSKSQARTKAKERVLAKEAAQRLN